MKRRGCSPPRRLENGYRDYSEEDVRTLEKIRLLRSLQLDIGTIRQLQRGTLTLEQVMFNQLTRLEGDRAGLERAARVCRAIRDSGVEYAALEPEPLLRELEGLEAAAQIPALWDEVEAKRRQAASHPWRRYLARWLDLSLWNLPVSAAAYLGLRLDLLADNLLLDWVLALASVAVMLLALVITLQWFLPPNRGELTAEEFSENCNYYLERLAPGGLWELGENGQWKYRDDLAAGAVLVFQEPYTRFPLELELTGDQVTAVTLRDVYWEDEVQLDQTYTAAVTLALAGAQRELNCFTFGYPGWTAFWEDRFQSFQEDYRGLSFCQQVEREGYSLSYGGWYEALGTGEQKIERTVTISLSD